MVTAAHVVEPILPGAHDSYLDLGRFYDADRLERRLSELQELTRRYRAAYASAYRFLAAAGKIVPSGAETFSEEALAEAEQSALACLPAAAPEKGSVRDCFLDAFCGSGPLSLFGQTEGWLVHPLTAPGKWGDRLLRRLSRRLTANGFGCLLCHDPLEPAQLRHVLIPSLKIAFTLSRSVWSHPEAPLYGALLQGAQEQLAAARLSHDALEEVYNPCVDFSGVYAEAERHIHAIL